MLRAGPNMTRIVASSTTVISSALSGERICVLNAHQGRIFIKHYTGRSWIGWDGKAINIIGDYISFLFKYEQPEQQQQQHRWQAPSLAYTSTGMMHVRLSVLLLMFVFVFVVAHTTRQRRHYVVYCRCCDVCKVWSCICNQFSCSSSTTSPFASTNSSRSLSTSLVYGIKNKESV